MPRYSIELSGTITRDIIWREVDAIDENEVRSICASEMPTYRFRSIILAQHLDGCLQKTLPSETCICDELETD